MILNRFIKSWKAAVILVLLCVIVFMGLVIDSQVRSQMQVLAENDQLKIDATAVKSWRDCMANTNLYTIDGEKYAKLTELQSCGN